VLAFGKWAENEAVSNGSGKVDILINNAGIFTPGSIYNEEDGLLQSMIETNVYSAYHLTRCLVPKMIEAKQGHIFNMCSIASLNAYANGGSYSISKFALLGFSKNLREELKPHHIKVTAVSPGAVMSDSWGDF
jgi:short-subunit dehydrogenase